MKKEHVLYFDLLNIFACICVIWLHCNSLVYTYNPTLHWYVSLFVQVACHFAVPVFFMISGANLMNYREHYSTKEFVYKRVTRTLVPLLIWSSVILFIKYQQGIIIPEDFQHIVFLFLTSGIETVYWFFFPLFGIYLSLPVLSLIAADRNRKYFLYMALMGIFFFSFLPFIQNRIGLGYSEYLLFPMAAGFLPYALLGWYFANTELSGTVTRLIYAVGIFCAFYMYYGTIAFSAKTGGLEKELIDYQSIVSYGFAAAVFLFFKNRKFRLFDRPKIRKAITTISSASFGIYLIHMLTMEVLLKLTGWNMSSLKWQLFGQIPVYLTALTIVLLVKKIPYLGKAIFP